MIKRCFLLGLLIGFSVLLNLNVSAQEDGCESYTNEFKLNTSAEVGTSWIVSSTSHDDWFLYFDNITTEGVNQTKYFETHRINLTLLETYHDQDQEYHVQGVWAAFYTEQNPPEHGQPYPVIQLRHSFQNIDRAEFSYFIHGDAKIKVYYSSTKFVEIVGKNDTSWMDYTMEIEQNHFKLEMNADTTEGDLVLVDFVTVAKCVLPTVENTRSTAPATPATSATSATPAPTGQTSISTFVTVGSTDPTLSTISESNPAPNCSPRLMSMEYLAVLTIILFMFNFCYSGYN